jgi:hypothetical protein
MSYGDNQLDVSHTLTTYFLLRHLYTTTVADDSFVTDTFVLTAMAFVIFNRAKNTLAEQAVTLRFVGTVIYGFRL